MFTVLTFLIFESCEYIAIKISKFQIWFQIWKRHVHPNVHHSTVYHTQDMEAT